MFSTKPKTACAGQSIDGEVVARAEPAADDGEPDLKNEGLAGRESADHSAEEMSGRRDHVKNLIGTI
jgi:hypothetical protein